MATAKQRSRSTVGTAYVTVYLLTSLASEGAFLPSGGSPATSVSVSGPGTGSGRLATTTTSAAAAATLRLLDAMRLASITGGLHHRLHESPARDLAADTSRVLSRARAGPGRKAGDVLMAGLSRLLSEDDLALDHDLTDLILLPSSLPAGLRNNPDTRPTPTWISHTHTSHGPTSTSWSLGGAGAGAGAGVGWGGDVESRDPDPHPASSDQLSAHPSKRQPEKDSPGSYKRMKPKFNPTGWRRKRSASTRTRRGGEFQRALRGLFKRLEIPVNPPPPAFPEIVDQVEGHDDVDTKIAEWRKRESLRRALERSLPEELKPKRKPLDFNPTGW